MQSDLTYYIFEGILIGTAGGRAFNMSALSGGGGGSTLHIPAASVNNPYKEALKTRGVHAHHVHGGPIPPGRYTVLKPCHHPHLGLSARLVHPKFKPMGRDGFYIHGRGPHGSDGCIVPLDAAKFHALMAALTQSNGGVLFVEESMGGARFG